MIALQSPSLIPSKPSPHLRRFNHKISKSLNNIEICSSPHAARIVHHLKSVKVEEVIPCEKCIHCIEDTQTVADLIEYMAQKKTSFTLVSRNHQLVALVDVVDIFSFCNDQLSISHPINTFEMVEQLEQLKYQLSKLLIRDVLPTHCHIQDKVNVHMSMFQLFKAFTSENSRVHMSTRRIPIIDDEGIVNAVATLLDIIHFLLDNKSQFEDKMKQKLSQVESLTVYSEEVENSRNEVMRNSFKTMWEKQINGKLGSCNTCSATDLFLNWIHYIRSTCALVWNEPARVSSSATVQKVLELFLREKIQEAYVIHPDTQKSIAIVTSADLLCHISK